MKVGINPYLFYPGTCEEAFTHYARVLGGDIAFLMRYREAPAADRANAAPEWQDKIMHVNLRIGDSAIMGGDAPPGHQRAPQGFATSITVASRADAERAFEGLAEGGSIYMPLSETFFSELFGMLTDRYGMSWMINFPGRVEARNVAERQKTSAAKSRAKPSKAGKKV